MTAALSRAALILVTLLAAVPSARGQSGPFAVEDLQVASDRDVPEVCFTLSDPLAAERRTPFGDFVAVEPAAELAVSARDRSLCLAGFDFGSRYRVVLRAGLPSAVGTALAADQGFEIYVPDRPASLAFRENGYVLPRGLAQGLPVGGSRSMRAASTA